jgi:hypothetical protein
VQKLVQGHKLPKPWEDFLLGNVGQVSDRTVREMMAGRLQLLKVRAEDMGLDKTSVPLSGTGLREELFQMEQFIAINNALDKAMSQWGMKFRVGAAMVNGKVQVRAIVNNGDTPSGNETVDFFEELEGFPAEGLMTKLQMINPEGK